MNKSIVYWIYNSKKHSNPLTQGYIGVTGGNLQGRLKSHIASITSPEDIVRNKSKLVTFLADENLEDIKIKPITRRLSADLAYKIENDMRPVRNIGWNGYAGGSRPSPKQALIITHPDGRTEPFDSIAAAQRAGYTRGNLSHVLNGRRKYFNYGCTAKYA